MEQEANSNVATTASWRHLANNHLCDRLTLTDAYAMGSLIAFDAA